MLKKDFASTLREKYPNGVASDGTPYAAMSDDDLVNRVVQKYPTYKAQLEDFKDTEQIGNPIIGNPIDAVKEFGSDVTKAVTERATNIKNAVVPQDEEGLKKIVEGGQGRMALRVGGQIGGLVGDLELSAVKLIAPKFAEDLALKGVKKIAETDFVKGITQKLDEFKQKHPEAAQDLEDTVNIAALIPYVKGAQKVAELGGEAVQKVSKITGEALEASRATRIANAAKEVDSVVGKIVQGNTDDILKAKKALSTINTTGVKTYQELGNRIDDGIEALAGKVDDILEKQSATTGKNVVETAGTATKAVKNTNSTKFIRFADDVNQTTDKYRGGTWFTNDSGSEVIKDAMNPKNVSEVGIGGGKKFALASAEPKNPLIVKNALLEDGSFAVINSGYEKFLPEKYAKAADNLYNDVHSGLNNADTVIKTELARAGFTPMETKNILTVTKKNKFDAAMDLIVSKGLKENGYDGLILKDGNAEHLFAFNSKVSPLEETAVKAGTLKAKDLVTSTQVGNKMVRQNFVTDALDQLDELYTSIKDAPKRAEVANIKAKLKGEGLTLKEVNDVSRMYGREFGSKAFSKIGDPLTSVNAQAFENTRKGIKNVVRNLMPDETVKMLDQRISDLYNTRRLVSKMEEKVNALYQKVQKRGILEQVAIQLADTANKLTFNTVSGFISRMLPSNVGLKVMNSIDLEKALQNNLKKISGLLRSSDDKLIRDQIVKIMKENAALGK